MDHKTSIKKIYIGFNICILAITFLFHLAIYFLNKDIIVHLLIFIYTIVLLSFIGLFVFLLRKKLNMFSSELCQTIDDMMNDKEKIHNLPEEETLLSRINHRLLRLYKVMRENRYHVITEREDLQELISDISHQVKTPIANLKMVNATLLKRKMTADKQKSFLQAADMQLDKLDFLMQSMIKTSRLEAGIITLAKEPCAIYETIALSLGNILLLAEKKNIDITVNCNPNLIIYHDIKWTSEALFNILENAVKYTNENGNIHILVEHWEMYTKIDIKDTGKGISEKHYAEIFKRFYREADVHNIDGIGIGLYLSRKIITLQGGYITVNSIRGKGTTFSTFLLNK